MKKTNLFNIKCSSCGHPIEPDHRFCTHCRADLRGSMTKCGQCGELFHSWFLPRKPACCPFCGEDKLIFPLLRPAVTPAEVRDLASVAKTI